jgi:hypothetical protein
VLLRRKRTKRAESGTVFLLIHDGLNPEQLIPPTSANGAILKLKAITRLDLTDSGFQANLKQYNEMCQKNRHDSEVFGKACVHLDSLPAKT